MTKQKKNKEIFKHTHTQLIQFIQTFSLSPNNNVFSPEPNCVLKSKNSIRLGAWEKSVAGRDPCKTPSGPILRGINRGEKRGRKHSYFTHKKPMIYSTFFDERTDKSSEKNNLYWSLLHRNSVSHVKWDVSSHPTLKVEPLPHLSSPSAAQTAFSKANLRILRIFSSQFPGRMCQHHKDYHHMLVWCGLPWPSVDCGVTYLVLAGQVDWQCQADDQNPEIRVPNWSPHAQILNNPINNWSTEGLKLKLVGEMVDQSHNLLFEEAPGFVLNQIHGEKREKPVITWSPHGGRDAG